MDKKELLELIGSIFIAVIFLSSYAAFGGTGSSTSNTSKKATVPLSRLIILTTVANASISNLSGTFSISTASCPNSSRVLSFLNSSEKNGSISFVAISSHDFNIVARNESAVQIIQGLENVESEPCINYSVLATVSLPKSLNFSESGKNVTLSVPSKFLSTQIPLSISHFSQSIQVNVIAGTTPSGSIEEMKISPR